MNPATHRSLQQEYFQYFTLKKKYKKQVKLMHKKYKNDLINEINALSSEHSQDVWRQINKLRKESTVHENTLISPEEWIPHFRQLLYDNNETNENTNFANDSDETENLSHDEILGKPITPKEIDEHISNLKTKKASSMDSTLNEMIKHGRYFLLPSLEKIFNDILNTGKFPTDWNIGMIKPICKKKGDRRSPANQIPLTSCLGKLFTSILQSRLNKYIEIHNILNPEQFGFRPNARTTDSLFILQQLLHKYTKQHEKLYVGFIDYEKAFDSVWQSGMIHKLQKEGIKGKSLKVIKSMYSSIRSCVKVNQNTMTESFLCNKAGAPYDNFRKISVRKTI